MSGPVMSRVRLFHWKAAEAEALLQMLRSAGHTVDFDEQIQPGGLSAMRQSPPDVVVIDLSRLPSHGREVATFLRGQKATRHIPIVFVDGAAEKVEAIRKLLPDAVYTPRTHLRSALKKALVERPASPVVPPQMMDRYASRTAAQKLGIRPGSTVALIDPPRNYAAAIGELPAGARFEEMPTAPCGVTLWFVDDAARYTQALPGMRKLAGATKLWILWRKGSEIKSEFIRESAIAVGLVDYKVCSVDATWSALAFARKKRKGARLSAPPHRRATPQK